MRDPTTTSYLPTLLQVRTDLQTALNRIDAYEVLCHRTEWAGVDTTEKQAGAFHTVCARVIAAANRLELRPEERSQLVRTLETLRIENTALRETNDRLRESNKHLEAALVRAVGGVKPHEYTRSSEPTSALHTRRGRVD